MPILEELRNSLLSYGPLTLHNEDVWGRICALNTWGSNAIEGNDLTMTEVETLILQGMSIGGQPVWKVLETLQYASAFMGLFDRVAKPITARTARVLHTQVFMGVVREAGRWRDVDLHIKGSKFVPPKATEVPAEMEVWREDYRDRCRTGAPVLDLAARMHHGFEAIHPFNGGNGRVGRLLLNLHFLKYDWPPVMIGLADRQVYFEALEAGNDGDLSPLEGFLSLTMGRALLVVLDLVGREEDRLRPLEVMEARGSGFLAYSEHMAEEGEFPAVRRGNTWHSSERALTLYNEQG